jgi:hypothetical protein
MRQTIPLRWPMVFPRTRGLCRLSPVPADGWSFPILSLHSLRRRLDPYPAVPSGCTRPFLPHRPRPRVTANTLGEPELSLSCNFSRERYFEAAVIRYLQAPTLARLPDCTYRTTSRRWAAGPFTPRIAGPVTCSPAVASLHVRFRAIDMTGLSPVGLQSYRLLLPALRFPVCYTSRVMRPVQPSPCGISSAPGLADFGCVYHFTPASHVDGDRTDSGVPLLGGHYSASLLLRTPPPPSPLRPTSRVHRLYGLPCSAAFAAGGGGLLQLLGASLSPCCRYHPAGVECRVSQSTTLDAAFTLSDVGSASEASHFRGHLCVRFRCGPVTCSHPYDGPVNGLQVIGFPPSCHSSYKASGSCLGGIVSR